MVPLAHIKQRSHSILCISFCPCDYFAQEDLNDLTCCCVFIKTSLDWVIDERRSRTQRKKLQSEIFGRLSSFFFKSVFKRCILFKEDSEGRQVRSNAQKWQKSIYLLSQSYSTLSQYSLHNSYKQVAQVQRQHISPGPLETHVKLPKLPMVHWIHISFK